MQGVPDNLLCGTWLTQGMPLHLHKAAALDGCVPLEETAMAAGAKDHSRITADA